MAWRLVLFRIIIDSKNSLQNEADDVPVLLYGALGPYRWSKDILSINIFLSSFKFASGEHILTFLLIEFIFISLVGFCILTEKSYKTLGVEVECRQVPTPKDIAETSSG